MTVTDILAPEKMNITGVEIINIAGFLELVLRFALNIGVICVLIRWLYYSSTKRKDYLFTYILISSVVFLLCYMLENVKLQIGFALGLFAIFGIIRYRTNPIPIKEMTYLFLIIGVSVINALTTSISSLADILFANLVIIFITCGLEKLWLLKHESSKLVIYEKTNLIKPENKEELLKDLRERTGIRNINRIDIGKIDFLKDTCDVTIYYYVSKPENLYGNNGKKDDDDE
jgi:hypothetical protein